MSCMATTLKVWATGLPFFRADKDLEFTRELARHGMTDSKIFLARLKETEVPPELRKVLVARIRRDAVESKKK